MGFIKEALARDEYELIYIEDIVLYLQSLDEDKPSLADTAKFLLRCYGDESFCFIDEIVYTLTLDENEYIRCDGGGVFVGFLEFVIKYNHFESGVSENGFKNYNGFLNYFFPIETVAEFLRMNCELIQYNHNDGLRKFIYQQEKNASKEYNSEIEALQAEITRLKSELTQQENNQNQRNSQAKRAENKQAEIITALAMMYTKTDCSKPYETAETIRQEWQRQADKLGNPPTNDTLAKYIKQGLERLKP